MSSTFNLRLSTCAAGALLLLLSAPSVAQVSGESAAAMIERMSAEMQQITQNPHPRRTPAQVASSCRNGFVGVVELTCFSAAAASMGNAGGCAWTPPAIAPGSAAGWFVRRTHRESVGNDSYVITISYEAVVRVAPQLAHRGAFGSVALIAVNRDGATNIDASGRPSYNTVTSARTGRSSQVERPLKTGYLQPLYEWRQHLGSAPPEMELFVGYGRISQSARNENARRSNANQTILPGILGNLNQQRSIMRENPDLARQTHALVCGQAPAGQGVATDAASLALMREQNAAMIAQMCRNVAPSDPMHSLCATSQQATARAAAMGTADRQARIEANRRPAQARTMAGQERQAQACAAGDIGRVIDVWEHDARLMAQDMESLGRAQIWHLRSAMEDAGANQTCWSVLRWTPPEPEPERGGN